ncbi:MAG: primosomal protein N' [Nitrospinaceae bacterium]|nr:primosomal protein N' [Nitrospinaceae bacterium]
MSEAKAKPARTYRLNPREADSDQRKAAGPLSVEVALNVPRLGALTYRVPDELADKLIPGMRVMVPLGRRRMTGYVASPPAPLLPDGPDNLKDVIRALDEEPALTEELIGLTRWVADYYCCGWGEAIRAALPGVGERKSVERVRLTDSGRREAALEAAGLGLPGMGGEKDAPLRARVLNTLKARPMKLDALAKGAGRGARQEAERLIEAGLIEKVSLDEGGGAPVLVRYVRLVAVPDAEAREYLDRRAPKQAKALKVIDNADDKRLMLRELERLVPGTRAACSAMEKKGWLAFEDDPPPADEDTAPESPHTAPPVELTDAQREAFDAVAEDLRGGAYSVTLLHGVTGSGKTEVYMRLAAEALAQGKGALVLVPEIGLTPQLLGRFRSRFGDKVACLHSAYPEKKRAAEWRRVRGGEAPIVLGTRSAVYAPLPNIGLITIDEEHDASYKQEDAPRYNARDTAIVRAKRAGVPIVLGSATPSLESYTRAKAGSYRLLELPSRPGGKPLPEVTLVDLRREQGGEHKTPPLLSAELAAAIQDRLARGEQALLFLNRRGFSSVILCRDCGASAQCQNCSVPMTFHLNARSGAGRLQCHLCDLSMPPPNECPACGSARVAYFGLGTERVEEAVKARFPKARVRRMDRDTVTRAGAYDEILGAVRRGEVDILIGTQMVAKGHDFPRMTLVGVVLADVGLHLPDFRAGERTFQLLTQVAGRAGRADLPGEVIVQTFRPEHYAVTCAKGHDYAAFYEMESKFRQETGYPPYRRLARLRFEARNPDAAAAAGAWVRNFMEKNGAKPAASRDGASAGLTFLGPAPAMLARVRGIYRHHMLVKSTTAKRLGEILHALDDAFHSQKNFGTVHLIIDVNPQSLL